MATYDLSEYLEDDAIVLEGIASEAFPDGKAYRFTSPSAKVGLWLKNLVEFGFYASLSDDDAAAPSSADALGKLVLDDGEERDLYQRVMGDTFAEMENDGVSWVRVQKVFGLLLMRWGANRDIEAQIQAGRPEAPGPGNRAARRAGQKRAGSSSSPASSATPARTRARTSTRSSGTSAGAQAAKTA